DQSASLLLYPDLQRRAQFGHVFVEGVQEVENPTGVKSDTPRNSRAQRLPPLVSANISGMHYLLIYTYVPDVLEKRPKFRGAHLGHARASLARGELVLAGAFADPVDG